MACTGSSDENKRKPALPHVFPWLGFTLAAFHHFENNNETSPTVLTNVTYNRCILRDSSSDEDVEDQTFTGRKRRFFKKANTNKAYPLKANGGVRECPYKTAHTHDFSNYTDKKGHPVMPREADLPTHRRKSERFEEENYEPDADTVAHGIQNLHFSDQFPDKTEFHGIYNNHLGEPPVNEKKGIQNLNFSDQFQDKTEFHGIHNNHLGEPPVNEKKGIQTSGENGADGNLAPPLCDTFSETREANYMNEQGATSSSFERQRTQQQIEQDQIKDFISFVQIFTPTLSDDQIQTAIFEYSNVYPDYALKVEAILQLSYEILEPKQCHQVLEIVCTAFLSSKDNETRNCAEILLMTIPGIAPWQSVPNLYNPCPDESDLPQKFWAGNRRSTYSAPHSGQQAYRGANTYPASDSGLTGPGCPPPATD